VMEYYATGRPLDTIDYVAPTPGQSGPLSSSPFWHMAGALDG